MKNHTIQIPGIVFSGIILGLAASHAFAAEGDVIDEDKINHVISGTIAVANQKVTLLQRTPISFKPFPMTDPISGKTLRPGDTITVGGKSMSAEKYFKELNDYEKELNAKGYTLRNRKDVELMSQIDLDMNPILESARIQDLLSINWDPKIMTNVNEVKAVLNDVKKDALDYEDSVLRGFEALASSNEPDGFQAKLTKLDEKVVKTPELPAVSANTHKEWGFGPENRDQVYVGGKAVFHLGAEKTKAELLTTARMDGKLLSQEFNLFYGHVKGNGDLAYTKQDATGSLSAEIYFNSLGRERFKWQKSASKSTKLPDLLVKKPADSPASSGSAPAGGSLSTPAPAPQSSAASASIEDPASTSVSGWLTATHESLKLEPWKYGTYKGWIWYFAIGPVPGNGEIGIDGSAYVDWGSGINVSGARANLVFGAKSSVWASGAVGVEVLRAGVYADLVLVDSSINLEGSATFRLGDGALAGNPQEAAERAYKEKLILEPQVVSEIKGIRRLTFLKGNVGAFAEIPSPTTEAPFWEKKKFTHEVFNWDGYSKDGVIFSFKKVSKLGSYNVFGAEAKDDVDSAALDYNLDALFNEVLADAGHEAALARNAELLERQNKVLREFSVFVDSLK